jgi:hypothetical protein
VHHGTITVCGTRNFNCAILISQINFVFKAGGAGQRDAVSRNELRDDPDRQGYGEAGGLACTWYAPVGLDGVGGNVDVAEVAESIGMYRKGRG